MCGICGIHWFGPERPVDPELLGAMTRIMEHRGPDDEGIHIEPGLGIGHRRLSIIGLDDGHQPMCTEDSSIWVTYSGELYNHPEIRNELESKGFVYRTTSDTESLLHLYEDQGLDFLRNARGMFSLALWDRARRRLILARDRQGIKPLFYYHRPGVGLWFASEIKSLLFNPRMMGIPRPCRASSAAIWRSSSVGSSEPSTSHNTKSASGIASVAVLTITSPSLWKG